MTRGYIEDIEERGKKKVAVRKTLQEIQDEDLGRYA
jgi:hypothetical protein